MKAMPLLFVMAALAAGQDARPTRTATALEMLTAAEKKWTEGPEFAIEGSLLLKDKNRETTGTITAKFGRDNDISAILDLGKLGKAEAFRKGDQLHVGGTLQLESEDDMEVAGGCSAGLMGIEPDTSLRFRRALARMGFASLMGDVLAAVAGDGPVISDCEFQPDEKFGARPVKVIDYTVRAEEGADPLVQRVWIDPETHEFLQRRSTTELLPLVTESYKPRK